MVEVLDNGSSVLANTRPNPMAEVEALQERKKMREAEAPTKAEAVEEIVEDVAPMIPGIGGAAGAVVSTAMSGVNANSYVKRALSGYTELFRQELAQIYKIHPAQVRVEHFLAESKRNKAFHEAVRSLNEDKSFKPVRTGSSVVAGIGGAAAGTVLIPIPILGSLIGAMGAGYLAGKATDKIEEVSSGVDKESTALAFVEDIVGKVSEGQPVTEIDVFRVKAALIPDIRKVVKAKTGKDLHEVPDANMLALLGTFDDELHLLCAREANAINNGARPQGLVFEGRQAAQEAANENAGPVYEPPAPVAEFAEHMPGGWVQRVGGKQSERGSHVQAEMQRRAANENAHNLSA